MFRVKDIFHPLARLVREADPALAPDAAGVRAEFEPDDESGTLVPVYSEIARRLSRNAYTSHGAF